MNPLAKTDLPYPAFIILSIVLITLSFLIAWGLSVIYGEAGGYISLFFIPLFLVAWFMALADIFLLTRFLAGRLLNKNTADPKSIAISITLIVTLVGGIILIFNKTSS